VTRLQATTSPKTSFQCSSPPRAIPPPLSIPFGNFYLGVTTGVGFTNGHPNRNVFGWLELNNTGTELLPVANAVDYGDGGIIIGTTTPAPEPASVALLAPVFLLLRRRMKPIWPTAMISLGGEK
jgi:hypothetical protein